MTTIIAEIGNNHEGNINVAIDMIGIAKDCGADLVKFQAGAAESFARSPGQLKFYKKCALTLDEYKKLYEAGLKIGIPVFFSIWSDEMEPLRYIEQYHKIAGRQYNQENIEKYDCTKTFISMPRNCYKDAFEYSHEPRHRDTPVKAKYTLVIGATWLHGTPMHTVLEYPCYNPGLRFIKLLRGIYGHAGYSDHTIGISTCITAVRNFRACAIEKHFTLPELRASSNFRDHIHSCTPEELKILVQEVK